MCAGTMPYRQDSPGTTTGSRHVKGMIMPAMLFLAWVARAPSLPSPRACPAQAESCRQVTLATAAAPDPAPMRQLPYRAGSPLPPPTAANICSVIGSKQCFTVYGVGHKHKRKTRFCMTLCRVTCFSPQIDGSRFEGPGGGRLRADLSCLLGSGSAA